jgi:hypothetical protein
MSVVIIIGGTGRLRTAIDNSNTAASTYHWTQAQIDWMAAKFNADADDIEKRIASFNAGNPP